MKYCKHCGGEINDEAVVCSHCGCQVEEIKQQESSGLSVAALIFSILGGWLGLVLDIVGLCTLKEKKNRTRCKIGLGIVVAWIVLFVIIFICL